MNTQFYTPGDQATSPMGGWNDGPRRRFGVGVDARKLWAGGVASAVVAGLLALVGVLVSRWLFNLPVLAPRQDGAYGDVRTTALILAATAAALAATGLVHLLMLGTLRPLLFFGWIVALVTTIAVIFPFSTTAALDAKIPRRWSAWPSALRPEPWSAGSRRDPSRERGSRNPID